MSRQFFWNLFKYALAFGLLAYVVQSNWQPDSDRGLAFVWNKHVVEGEPLAYGSLLLSLVMISSSVIVTFVRWYGLVRAQDLPFTMKDAFRLGMNGLFFSTFLPGSVGGDVVKAAGIARGQKRRTVAVATVLMDRAIAVWAMVWMVAGLGLIFWLNGMLDGASSTAAKRLVRSAGIIVAVSVVVWTVLGFLPQLRADMFARRLTHIPKIGHSAAEFWRAVWMYRCRPTSVYLALALTWVGQIGFVLGFYFGVKALWDLDLVQAPSIADHFLLVPVGLIIQAAPLFPGGAGIGEAGFGGLYQWFNCDSALGVLGSLVMRLNMWTCAVFGFLIAQRMQPAAVGEPEELPESPPVQPACASTATVVG